MKIAFLSLYNGIYNRGVETFVHELSTELTKLGYEVEVFQSGESNKTNYIVNKISVVIDNDKKRKQDIFAKFFLDYWGILVLNFTLKSLSKLKNYDVIFPLNGGWQSILVRLVTWAYGKKYILVAQSGIGWDDRINALTFPDLFVGFTDFQCNWAKSVNPFIKVVKVPNGVNLDIFKLAGSKIKTNLKKPIILSVGALTSIKRQDLLIKAVSKLKNCSLLLIGDGPDKNHLEKLGKKLLKNRFEIQKLDYSDMPKAYRTATIFSFSTSPWESFGMVMLEAMATNVPVVASDDPIRREIVGDAGLFVDPVNTQEYSDTLKSALIKKWAEIPINRAKEFSWKVIAKKYNRYIKDLSND